MYHSPVLLELMGQSIRVNQQAATMEEEAKIKVTQREVSQISAGHKLAKHSKVS